MPRRNAHLVALSCALGWAASLGAGVSRADGGSDPVPLVTEAVVDAPVAEVWAVFTTPEGWRALGVAQADVDLRVGGVIRSHYDPKGTLGDEETIENTILAFEPERLLALKATRTPRGFPFPPEVVERTWSVVAFTDLGDGRTRVSVRGHGYGTDPASRRMREFFARGNDWTLAQLRRHLAARRTAVASGPVARVEVVTHVAARLDDVYAAFTSARRWSEAFGATATFDLSIGGAFRFETQPRSPAAEAGEGVVAGTVQAWLPGRLLALAVNGGGTAPPSLVVVEFEAEGRATTRVRLTHHGLGAEPDGLARAERRWSAVLDAMRRTLAR